MIKVGIIGGAGYTAGELCRILLNHPEAEIVFINSSSNAGNKITDVHEGLYGDTDLTFTDQLPLDEVDVIFFCFGHGKSEEFLREHEIPAHVKIIDLAQDFRLAAPGNDYVYGLPELNGEAIIKVIRKISFSIPLGIPVLDDADSHAMRINFLSHSALLLFLVQNHSNVACSL